MHLIKAKTILSSGGGTGTNVYRGCTHGCIYCDSRSKCYHTPEPFEDIEVKINAPELLEEALKKKRKKMMIGTGSMCDPYMPVEKELLITRKCLEVIDKYDFGVQVQTKSNLVLRDFDLLKKINSKTKAVLQMTLTTADDNLCRFIEPAVCVTSERFKVLMEAKKEGIPTVVWLSPFLPFINDSRENIRALLEMCGEAEVKGIIFFGIGVTLREGNREYFYEQLDKYFPGAKEHYIKTFGSSYECGSPYSRELSKMITDFCKTNGILSTPDDCFSYLHLFEEKKPQINIQPSLF